MSSWFAGRHSQTQAKQEAAATRLDCFLSVVYIFPSCIEARDMDLLATRENELTKIYRYSGWTFLGAYGLCSLATVAMSGRMPYFRKFMTHSILAGTGTFASAHLGEWVAAEMYYNKLLIRLADKYNFTPEEVMDLQRNLNQYYIKKDRETDI